MARGDGEGEEREGRSEEEEVEVFEFFFSPSFFVLPSLCDIRMLAPTPFCHFRRNLFRQEPRTRQELIRTASRRRNEGEKGVARRRGMTGGNCLLLTRSFFRKEEKENSNSKLKHRLSLLTSLGTRSMGGSCSSTCGGVSSGRFSASSERGTYSVAPALRREGAIGLYRFFVFFFRFFRFLLVC